MNLCPCCGKQYAEGVTSCPADGETLKRLTCVADGYLAHFLAVLPYGFEECPELGPHARSTTGDTPLHIAAVSGDLRAIDLLLNVGADINAAGENGFTPLHYAAEQNRPEAVRLLLTRGADRNKQDRFGQLPYELAELTGPRVASAFDEDAT